LETFSLKLVVQIKTHSNPKCILLNPKCILNPNRILNKVVVGLEVNHVKVAEKEEEVEREEAETALEEIANIKLFLFV
jgi:hypothetical protein